jgi:hypothetical protein
VLKCYFAGIISVHSNIYDKREGSGSISESTPLTNGSGSGRPKNMWILQIQIRFRIPNTAYSNKKIPFLKVFFDAVAYSAKNF